jgi:anti-anti-sigma factor
MHEGEPSFEIGPLSWDYGLRISGELDLLTAPKVATALLDLDRDEDIVLDLSELVFVDSVGMHVLLTFARSFDRARPLVIANPSPVVLRLLELACVKDLPTVSIRTDEPGDTSAAVAESLHDLARRAASSALEPELHSPSVRDRGFAKRFRWDSIPVETREEHSGTGRTAPGPGVPIRVPEPPGPDLIPEPAPDPRPPDVTPTPDPQVPPDPQPPDPEPPRPPELPPDAGR